MTNRGEALCSSPISDAYPGNPRLGSGLGLDLAFVAIFARRDQRIESAELQMDHEGLVRLVLEIPAMNALERRDQRAARCKTGGLLVFHHRGFRVGRIRSRFAVEVVIEPFRMSLIAGHVP